MGTKQSFESGKTDMNPSSNKHYTLITGGTGFVGNHLLNHFDNVIVTSRNPEKAKQRLGDSIADARNWPDMNISPDTKIRSVVNLMGESIAEGRWNEEKKKRIRNSRILGTRRLIEEMLGWDNLPEVLVSASAVGLYGCCGDDVVEEDYREGKGFLAEVCQEWENEALRMTDHGVRVVLIRIGLVLGHGGGAIEKMVPLFKWGLGGKLGNGKQFMPWIHVEDLCRLIAWAVNQPDIEGPLNGTAPNPVRNAEFTRQLAARLNRSAFLPAPKFGLKIALGEFANSLFVSQRVVPAAAEKAGFEFKHASLEQALADIIPE